MTPEQYKTLAENEAAAAAFIDYWAREHQTHDAKGRIPRFYGVTQDGKTRFMAPKSQMRALFTDNFETNGPQGMMTHPWYGYTNNYKWMLDHTTCYRERTDSMRLKRAKQVGLEGYACMSGSLKLLTPKDIFILMTILPATKFIRAGIWRQTTGISLMTPKFAAQYWGLLTNEGNS